VSLKQALQFGVRLCRHQSLNESARQGTVLGQFQTAAAKGLCFNEATHELGAEALAVQRRP
jgi:hypothetical protein